jgi:hypothetical protein
MSEQENRSKNRLSRNETVTLEVLHRDDGEPRIIQTQTLDFSEEGLKVRLAEEISKIGEVALVIEPLERDVQFHLSGQVRWCRRILDSLFEAGIQIDEDSKDYQRWLDYVDGPPPAAASE